LHKSVGIVFAFFTLASVTACDPCSGVVACVGDDRIAVEGELVRQFDGAPMAGVSVTLVQTAGPGLAADSLVTLTDERGRFAFAARTGESGTVSAQFIVSPPGKTPYRVDDLNFATTRDRGHGHVLPAWVTEPYFPYAGELYYEETGARVAGARVDFVRTGGAALEGDRWRSGGYRAVSDAAGRVPLMDLVWANGGGDVVGNIVVHIPGTTRRQTITGVRLGSTHIANAPTTIIRIPIALNLNWVGELFFRDTGQRAAGVEVEFRRTGGVPVEPAVFTVRTDQFGRFSLMPRALEEGEVVFDLLIRPPSPYSAFTIKDVRENTTFGSRQRLIGLWAVGNHLAYTGELQWGDTYERAAGVEVEFRRIGGIAVDPDTFVVRTDVNGRFPLTPRPLEQEGEVIFELLVRPPAPYRPVTIGPLRMAPHPEDNSKLLGVWLVPPP
jgi:hypothetical protein